MSESKGPSNFPGVGKYPPPHLALCLLKRLLLVWDQVNLRKPGVESGADWVSIRDGEEEMVFSVSIWTRY